MSCCKNCANHWLHCGDFFYSRGLGSLDLPPNQSGASFALSFEANGWDLLTDLSIWTTNQLLENIRLAVQASGFVQTPVRVYTLNDSPINFNPYVVIEGRAAYAHSSASHLRDAILSAVQNVISYDAGSVRFEADTYNPQTGEANTDPTLRRYDAPTGGNNVAPINQPGFAWPNWIRRASYETGVSPVVVVGGVIVVGVVGFSFLKRRI